MKFSARIDIVIALLLSVLLCGCMGAARPPEPIYYYTLDYTAPGPSFSVPTPCVLRLERFVASPPYDTQRIIYSDGNALRNNYAYHQWIAAPGELVPYLLARDLQYTGGFAAVVPPDSAVRATHSVYGWIEYFLEEDSAQAWTASAAVHITLISNSASDPTSRILLQQRYAAQAPSSAKTPAALAGAMAEVVSRISVAMSRDIYNRLTE